jgi:DNA ligase D-like protein (predicted 3'-phosphoesterase)
VPDPMFVIQQHAARTLHFDFRLEVDGVLRSWAVPRGPSLDPAEKRLAVEVEDHSLEYGDFEGVIGAGSYGAGGVIVWDTGTWRPLDGRSDPGRSAPAALHAGHLSFWLDGRKLRGGWTLHRTRERGPRGGKPQWLLVKRRDDEADAARDPVADEPESVLSGRTLEEIVAGRGG